MTAINCMDGRVQEPLIKFLKENYRHDYVDMITEAGPIKYLADNINSTIINSIKDRLDISINKHGSQIVAIAGHHDCAGNPVDKDTQTKHIQASIKNLQAVYRDITFIGLWVDEKLEVHLL